MKVKKSVSMGWLAFGISLKWWWEELQVRAFLGFQLPSMNQQMTHSMLLQRNLPENIASSGNGCNHCKITTSLQWRTFTCNTEFVRVSQRDTERRRRAGVSERKGRSQSEEECCWMRLCSGVWSHTALQRAGEESGAAFGCTENWFERKYLMHSRTDTWWWKQCAQAHLMYLPLQSLIQTRGSRLCFFFGTKPALFHLRLRRKLTHIQATRGEVEVLKFGTSCIQSWNKLL